MEEENHPSSFALDDIVEPSLRFLFVSPNERTDTVHRVLAQDQLFNRASFIVNILELVDLKITPSLLLKRIPRHFIGAYHKVVCRHGEMLSCARPPNLLRRREAWLIQWAKSIEHLAVYHDPALDLSEKTKLISELFDIVKRLNSDRLCPRGRETTYMSKLRWKAINLPGRCVMKIPALHSRGPFIISSVFAVEF